MNRLANGIYLVPGNHDQDDVDYFARAWKELSQPENPAPLPPPIVASGAIRASALTPGSLSALKPFAIGSQRYQPGEVIDCTDTPSLGEALVRFGYASRLPAAAVTPNRVSQGTRASAKERLKQALADVRSGQRVKRS
jgi:hypothetical protein